MKKPKLPTIDSIQQLAEFWDTHDFTDFEVELEDVPEPIFVRSTAIKVPLESRQVEAVEQMAKAKGVSREELIRAWVLQKLARRIRPDRPVTETYASGTTSSRR
jgi:CopG antitoxin of type II toxin-antitoxin system